MSWTRNVAVLLIGVVILSLFYNFAINQVDPGLYFDPAETASAIRSAPIWRILATALAMVIGIAFGVFYDALRDRETIRSYRRELRSLVYSARFARSFLAAPIVFVGVYLAAQTEPDLVVSLIFAFENGFFCDAVMKSKERSESA